MEVGVPVSHLQLSPQYGQLAIASSHGTIHLYKMGSNANTHQLLNDSWGEIVGLDALGGDGYLIARSCGLVQVKLIMIFFFLLEENMINCCPI